MRNRDRKSLTPFFPLLKLMIIGLQKLPPTKKYVYRGANLNLKDKYTKKQGKSEIWWSFGSTTEIISVIKNFLGSGDRTMFIISAQTARDINRYSAIPKEKELLLLPGTAFVVNSILDESPLTIVQLEEKIDPDFVIIPTSISVQPSVQQSIPVQPSVQRPLPIRSTPLQPTPVQPSVHQTSKVNEVKWRENFTCVGCGKTHIYAATKTSTTTKIFASSFSLGGKSTFYRALTFSRKIIFGFTEDTYKCMHCQTLVKFSDC